jgi:hypothetical protein
LATVSNASARIRGMTKSVQNATSRFEYRIAIFRLHSTLRSNGEANAPVGRFINACDAVAVDLGSSTWRMV